MGQTFTKLPENSPFFNAVQNVPLKWADVRNVNDCSYYYRRESQLKIAGLDMGVPPSTDVDLSGLHHKILSQFAGK